MAVIETYRCDICDKKVKDKKNLTTIYENTHIYMSGAFGSNGSDMVEETDMCNICLKKLKDWIKNNKHTAMNK